MKFTIQQKTLIGSLRKLASIAPDATSLNATVPGSDAVNAVSSILIEPNQDGTTRWTATDNTLRLTFTLPVEGEDLKPCTVPASPLLHICSKLPSDAKIRFELVKDGKTMKVSHSRSRYNLATVDPDEFPGITSQDDEYELGMPGTTLQSLLSSVRYAAAQNDMRYYLLGVLLDVGPESVTAVATDGHRMAVDEHALQTGLSEPVQLIVPSKGVDKLVQILADRENQESALVLHMAGNHLRLDLPEEGCEFHVMLIDGKYPDYRTVVPKERKVRAKVERPELIQAAERLIPVTDELTQAVILTFKEGETLEVEAKNNKGDIGEESVKMELTRDKGAAEGEIRISINIKYLIDALRTLTDEAVVLGVDDGGKSMLIVPQDLSSKHIIMPMKA